jgi:hypothetical protein
MKRYSWLIVFLESLTYLLVMAPVLDLARHLPTHEFSAAGWNYWPLGNWFEGRFEAVEVVAFLALAWVLAAMRRHDRKELFDE